ncbi:MAG: hypothetical protein JWQ28_935 [Pedobacter sp.]|jgi:hypothetical protein|nr:hypothetical protein [Pedobacter sp.]
MCGLMPHVFCADMRIRIKMFYNMSQLLCIFVKHLIIDLVIIALVILLVLAVFSCLSIYFNAKEVDRDDDNF